MGSTSTETLDLLGEAYTFKIIKTELQKAMKVKHFRENNYIALYIYIKKDTKEAYLWRTVYC